MVSRGVRNSGNCTLIGCVGCYDYMVTYSIFRPKHNWKTINIFSHFHGFITETNYEHFIMLWMHSKHHRDQMSLICYISPKIQNYHQLNRRLCPLSKDIHICKWTKILVKILLLSKELSATRLLWWFRLLLM